MAFQQGRGKKNDGLLGLMRIWKVYDMIDTVDETIVKKKKIFLKKKTNLVSELDTGWHKKQ